MGNLAAVLHEIIDAVKHTMTPNRVGELHKAIDDVASVESDITAIKAALDKLAPPAAPAPAPAPEAPAAPAAPADVAPPA